MGYSASVACKSIKARDKLSEFLISNLVPWSELTKGTRLEYNPNYDYTRFVRVADELSYGSSNSRVGFDFSTQNDPGSYMWAILKWSALKVGRVAKFPKKIGNDNYVQYVTYDGYDHIPVLPSNEYSKEQVKEYYIVDRFGCPLRPPKLTGIRFLLDLGISKQVHSIVCDAMRDLDNKWSICLTDNY